MRTCDGACRPLGKNLDLSPSADPLVRGGGTRTDLSQKRSIDTRRLSRHMRRQALRKDRDPVSNEIHSVMPTRWANLTKGSRKGRVR